MAEEGGDESGWKRMQVISNSVIIRRLEKYLSYDDFKACRLVSREFNSSIVEKSSFSSRTKFTIKEETVRSGVFSQLSFNLKNVDVYLFDKDAEEKLEIVGEEELPILTEEQLEPLYECFSGVESLKLYDEFLHTESPDRVFPDVPRLIGAIESLKELRLSTWDVNLFTSLEDPKEVLEKLRDVVSLELIPHRYLLTYGLNEEGLKEISKLQRVKIRDGYAAELDEGDEDDVPGTLRTMGELVARSANTITSLKISEPCLWTKFSEANAKYICDTRFPKLQELRIRAKNDQAVEISNFLAAHGKQLTSLGIRILGAFPCDIIDGIRQEASRKLKKLTIATNAFDQSRSRNLAFLEDFHELESFKLQFISSTSYDPNCDSMIDVFSFVPTKNLRKLSLCRLPTHWNESLDHVKIEALSGLKYLALDWCGKAVNDDTINAIFKYMTELEYLRIRQAIECGVKGFTGTENIEDPTPEPGKVAASNLIKLKHLVLQHCGLDDHIVKVALKFKDLEILDISDNHYVTKASCKIAVSQNPALRVLRTDEYDEDDDEVTESELKSLNARFQSYETASGGDHDRDSSDDDGVESDYSFPGDRWFHGDIDEDDLDGFDFMGHDFGDDYDHDEFDGFGFFG